MPSKNKTDERRLRMGIVTDNEWLVDELGKYADRISSWLTTTPPETNDDTVRLLVAVRDLRTDLAFVASELERDLLKNNPPKRFAVDGAEVEIKKSTTRNKWQNDDLMKVVVARALDERAMDPETGEMLEPGWQTVARVVSDCMRPSWRLTPLRSRGIDPDEFCSVEESHMSVVLPPRK
jgi:hypothetical protein